MGISQKIDNIIEQRKSRLPLLEEKMQQMEKMRNVLADVEYMKMQMLDEEGNARVDGKYAVLLQQNPEMAWKLQGIDFRECRQAIENAMKVLQESYTRFSRDYVSISVIGEARKGKSELLKSISSLSNKVIPAFDSTDCTGAASIIYNQPGTGLRAKITFKSRKQMLDMAQEYLEKIISDKSKMIYISSMEAIRRLDMNDIRDNRIEAGDVGGIYLEYLNKMVAHYDEWSKYAGKEEPLIMEDEDEIALFVAQNNGKPEGDPSREMYYRYLAVESCEIFCSFPLQNAGKLALIDTVGLTDHALGIEDGMLMTVKEKSDAVIFMLMPTSGAAHGLPTCVTDIYKNVVNVCSDKKLDDWLFWLINHVPAPTPTGRPAVNTDLCNSTYKRLQEVGYHGRKSAKIINVMDKEAVREQFLLSLLEQLTQKLDSVDQIYMDQAEAAVKNVRTEFNQLCVKVQKVLQSDINKNASMIPLINQMTDDAKRKMRTELFGLMNQWLEKRNQPCPVVYNSAKIILNKMSQPMKGAFLPTQEQVLAELSTGIQPATLYTNYLNEIRNAISKDFLEVNVQLEKVVNQMKDDVARVMYDLCEFRMLCEHDEEEPLYLWLQSFSEKVLGDETDYPNIKLAFDTLSGFEFSVKGFLTYEVRNCLDELDPRLTNIPLLVPNDNNMKKTAGNICSRLLLTLCDIARRLEQVLHELCVKPNRALFAEVIEFYDRLLYAEGVEAEWRNFYAEKSGVLWSEQIKNVQSVSILCQEWLDLLEMMQKLNK